MFIRKGGPGQRVRHAVRHDAGDGDVGSGAVSADDFVIQAPLEAEIVDHGWVEDRIPTATKKRVCVTAGPFAVTELLFTDVLEL